jgi:hypothetical protein
LLIVAISISQSFSRESESAALLHDYAEKEVRYDRNDCGKGSASVRRAEKRSAFLASSVTTSYI